MTTFAELRAKVRGVLQDASGNYWTDDELDLYLNEAQEEFCRHTRVLRGEHPVTTRENQAVYTLPEDCLEVLRVLGKNGTEVQPTQSTSLAGYNLADTGTGDPLYRYSDLDGDDKMRFYPQPNPTLDTGPLTFTNIGKYGPQEVSLPVTFSGNVKGIASGNGLLYVADDTNVYEFTPGFTLRRQTAHGFAGEVLIKVVPITAESGFDGGEIVIAEYAGNTLKLIDTAGAISTITASTTAGIAILCDIPKINADFFMWQGDDGVLYRSTAAIWAEQNDGTFIVRGSVADDDTVYVTGGAGLSKRSTAGGAFTAENTQVLGGISEISPGSYYVNHNGTLATWDGSGDVVDTAIAGLTATGWVHASNSGKAWADATSAGDLAVLGIVGTTSAENDIDDSLSLNDHRVAMLGNALFFVHKDDASARVVFSLSDTASDCGAVVNIDNAPVNQEEGIVVDIVTDSDDLVTFGSEDGAIVIMHSSAKVATVYYVRKPFSHKVEISDPLALVWYAISRAYEQDGEQSHLARSQYYAQKFRGVMARTKRRVAAGFNGSSITQIRTF